MLALDDRITSGATRSKVPVFDYISPVATEYFVSKENGVFVEGISLLDTAPTEELCYLRCRDRVHEIIFFVQGHAKEAYIEIHLDHKQHN